MHEQAKPITELNSPNFKGLSGSDGEPNHSKNVFLLTGKPGIGKSTMIKKLINDIGADICGGFYTEEITDAKGRVGFRCVSMNGESVEIANVENPSQTRIGRYGVDIETFEPFAIKVLQDALSSKRIIVIDEIGFMQMLSVSFQHIVQKVVSLSDHIVLGTVPVTGHPEIDKIKYSKNATIIGLNEFNRDVLAEVLANEILQKKGCQHGSV